MNQVLITSSAGKQTGAG